MSPWKLAITVSFIFVISSWSIKAQVNIAGAIISTTPEASIYPVPKGMYYPSTTRSVYDYIAKERAKRVSKPQDLQVICLTNCTPSVEYDTYVVSFKGKHYYVPISSVSDNHIIDAVNHSLSEEFEQKTNAVKYNEKRHKEAFEMIIKGIDRQIEINNQHMDEIERNADSLEFEFIKREVARDIKEKREKRDRYYSWIKNLPKTIQPAAKKLAITNSYFEGGYAGAFDYCMSFVNWSDKTIKYLYWTGKVKNSVGDYISCQVRKQSTFTGRYVGPAASLCREFSSWDNIIFNGEAEEMVLTSVRILYTDGSSYSIDQASLKYITSIPSDVIDKWDLVFDSSYEGLSEEELKAPWVLESSRSEFRHELEKEKNDCWYKNHYWEHLKKRIREWGLWSIEVSNLGWGDTHQKENEPILTELNLYDSTRVARKGLIAELELFRKANLLSD